MNFLKWDAYFFIHSAVTQFAENSTLTLLCFKVDTFYTIDNFTV